ncbi:MAG TPA: MoaD/ThiS family protein [Symbiobacteriaceae bacterium]|nr:MoaD/ThiS family protein [Symbiobacteriaceae bacterium]
MGERLIIRLEVYLPFRGQRIWRGDEAIAAGTTVADLRSALAIGEPELAVLVNGRHAKEEAVLADGDEVAILRQSEGG